jgi:hypothetical protein
VLVDSHSWRQVHPHAIDATDFDAGNEVYYDSHRGARLKSAPCARAKTAFDKLAAENPESYLNRSVAAGGRR